MGSPAYAGKRTSCAFSHHSPRDHPRLCGEKLMRSSTCFSSGSPPPMRGKGDLWIAHLRPTRITPAYAGKSVKLYELFFCRRDHPRLCGEKRWSDDTACKVPGSPPPMRGKGKKCLQVYAVGGITPAYAGKSKNNR